MSQDIPPLFLMLMKSQEVRCPECGRLECTVLGLCLITVKCKRCGTWFVWPTLTSQRQSDVPRGVLECYANASNGSSVPISSISSTPHTPKTQ